MQRSVGIIGASGLIGSHLATAFESRGWRVVRMSRTPRAKENQLWATISPESIKGLDALINLAGESVSQRWTDSNKKLFHASRVDLAKQLAHWLAELPEEQRPSRWLNASAIGIYGDSGDLELPESAPTGTGYLANLCQQWEVATQTPPLSNCRIIIPRIGVVLGKGAPAWEKMRFPFSLGLGGKLGNGRQWFPWVHLQDVVDSLIHLTEHPTAAGPFNIVAPEPIRNSTFTHSLGQALHRPTFCCVPKFALQLLLGEFSSALLASQRVTPNALKDIDFEWSYPTLRQALEALTAP